MGRLAREIISVLIINEYYIDVSEQYKLLTDTKHRRKDCGNLLSGIKRMRARWRKCRTWILLIRICGDCRGIRKE